MVYDVCIVGTGLWGSAAARHATKSGRKVCLIGPREPTEKERPSRDIFSSHYDAGRNVRKYQGTDHIRSLLTMRTLESLKNLEQITGIKLFSDVGHLFYGKDIDGQLTAIAKEGGRFFSASEVQDLYPFLNTSKYGDQAFLFPQDAGYVNPRLVVAAQQKVAKEQGCDIIDDVVESVEEESYQTDKEAVMKIITKSGNIFWSKKVLLCCGVFTQLKDLLPRDLELDLKVDGTFVVKLELGDEDVVRLSTMPTGTSITDPELNCYFLPPIKYPDGKTYMKIGPGYFYQTRLTTLEDVKRWYLSAPNQDYVDKLKDIVLSIVKGITPLSVQSETCACSRTSTSLPYCDMVSPRLGLAVGGYGFGAMMSDEIGRIAAKMIGGDEKWNMDIPREKLKARYVTQSAKL